MMNLVTLTDPQSPAAEAYQSLRTNLEFSNLDKSVRTLVLAGTDSTVDAAAAAANLAVVMAQAGDRVLLVDGNLREPGSTSWSACRTRAASRPGWSMAACRRCRRRGWMGYRC